MNKRTTTSILRQFALIREVTATYLGLPPVELARLAYARPTQPQGGARRQQ